MPYHACFRIFAGIDMILSIFCGILWWIHFRRAETLIHLQFEINSPSNLSFSAEASTASRNFLNKYRVVIPSVGSSHTDRDSAQILQEYFDTVHKSCQKAYKDAKIQVPTDKQSKAKFIETLIKHTRYLVSCVFLAIALFVIIDAIMINSTKQVGSASGKLILACLLLYLITLGGYCVAAFWLEFDPKFCAHRSDLRPLTPIIIVASAIVKPLQVGVICRYGCDVARGIYGDGDEADLELAEDEADERGVPEPEPEEQRSKPRPSVFQQMTFRDEKATATTDVNRKKSLTDLTKV